MGKFPSDVAVSPDGRRAYVLYIDGVVVVDTASNAIVGTLASREGGWPQRAVLSPDGGRLYFTRTSGSLVAVDTATMIQTGSAPVDGELPEELAITPDGRKLYVGHSGTQITQATEDGVSVFDATTLTEIASVPIGGRIHGISMAPSGTRVVVTGERPKVIDTRGDTVVADLPNVRDDLRFAPNGTCAYAAASYGNVPVVDTRDLGRPGDLGAVNVAAREELGSVRAVAVSRDNRYLFAAMSVGQRGRLVVADLADRRTVGRLDLGAEPRHLAISPDGRRLYLTGSSTELLTVVDISAYS